MTLGILCSVVLAGNSDKLYSRSIIYCLIGSVNVVVKNIQASEYMSHYFWHVTRLGIFQFI